MIAREGMESCGGKVSTKREVYRSNKKEQKRKAGGKAHKFADRKLVGSQMWQRKEEAEEAN